VISTVQKLPLSSTAIKYNATTFSTQFEFTSIPSYTKRITIIVRDLQHTSSGNQYIYVQLGTASAYVTTGYNTNIGYINGGTGQDGNTNYPGLLLTGSAPQTSVNTGTFVLSLITDSTWVLSGTSMYTGIGATSIANGSIYLGSGATISKLKVIASANPNMYGTVNIFYE
jgi:hypothetical protein